MARCLTCVVQKKGPARGWPKVVLNQQQGDTRPVGAWQVDFMVDRLSGEVGDRKKFLGAGVTIVLRVVAATPGGGARQAVRWPGGLRAVRRWPARRAQVASAGGAGAWWPDPPGQKCAALPYIGSGHKRAGWRVCAIRCAQPGRQGGRQGSSRPAAPCHRVPRPRSAQAA